MEIFLQKFISIENLLIGICVSIYFENIFSISNSRMNVYLFNILLNEQDVHQIRSSICLCEFFPWVYRKYLICVRKPVLCNE